MGHSHRIAVRFSDCDMYEHVNNAVYLTYFEEARAAFWRRVRGDAFRSFEFIIAEITCTYHSPATYGEALVVTVTVGAIGNKSFQLNYRIEEEATGRLVATGRSAQVMYDHAAKATTPMAYDVRCALEAVRTP
jgi:acyl-CoA thioester hydrolase